MLCMQTTINNWVDKVVTPQDDPSIVANDKLIRGITNRYIVGDHGEKRVSSLAFKLSSPKLGLGMSVFIEKLIHAANKTIEDVSPRDHIGSIAFMAGDVRALGLAVAKTPKANNPYHGDVWNLIAENPRKFKNLQIEGLREKAVWVKPIDGVVLK